MRVINNGTVALNTGSSTQISEEQFGAQRLLISITNLNLAGGETIYLANGAEAGSGKGIPLLPGQTMVMSKDSGYSPSNLRWSAYSAVAGSSVAIYEEISRGG